MRSAADILKDWLRYSEYDPDRKSFTIGSLDFEWKLCNDRIAKIMDFDPSGSLAVIYAKHVFEKTMADYRVKIFDVLTNPDALNDEIEMWRSFSSDAVVSIGNSILDKIDEALDASVQKKRLGERDKEAELKTLSNSVEAIVNDLGKCQTELYLRGGQMKPVGFVCLNIQVFERLADCLLTLEQARDGVYLCYIRMHDSADGYFGFFIKSNGNILSINERVDESYPGQHVNSRNGRWSEEKAYSIFPYSHMFSFDDYDYKGYSNKHIINTDQLAIFELPADVHLPIVIAMVLLNSKFGEANLDGIKQKYVDTLLSWNMQNALPGEQALIVPNGSEIALVNNSFTPNLTTDNVLDWNYSNRFLDPGLHYTERGEFAENQSIFVEMYGDGFELNTSQLLERKPTVKYLGNGKHERIPTAEFVATKERMELIAYAQGREQLAEHIRNKMFEEYIAFGGVPAILSWYENAIKSNRSGIYRLCAEKYLRHQAKEEANVTGFGWKDATGNKLGFISYDDSWRISYMPLNGSNISERIYTVKPYCPIKGCKASIFFYFDPRNWLDIIRIVGKEEIPKILTGWIRDSRMVYGNPLLRVTDPVSGVGTPFEERESNTNKRYWSREKWRSYYFHSHDYDLMHEEPPTPTIETHRVPSFNFTVALSKRAFNEILKEVQHGE